VQRATHALPPRLTAPRLVLGSGRLRGVPSIQPSRVFCVTVTVHPSARTGQVHVAAGIRLGWVLFVLERKLPSRVESSRGEVRTVVYVSWYGMR
jgi:hypothetical protein